MKKLLYTLTVLLFAFTAFSKTVNVAQGNESSVIKEAVVVESSKEIVPLKALLPSLPPKFQSRIANGAPVSYVVVRILESGEQVSGITFGDYVSGEVVKVVIDQQKLDNILNLIR